MNDLTRVAALGLAALALVGGATGCEVTSPGETCSPGEVQACSCGPGLAVGTQRCASDGTGWEPCECPEGDAGPDADADPDVEVDADAEIDAEPDAEPVDPFAGCIGSAIDERWLVAAEVGGLPGAYLTGRDCSAPVALCSGCVPASISPSGERALVVVPGSDEWRLADTIALADLGHAGGPAESLGLLGTLPVWIDDDSFLYIAAADLEAGPCASAEALELTELRRHDVASGSDEPVGARVRRGWVSGFPAPSPSSGRVAIGIDLSTRCSAYRVSVMLRDLGDGADQLLEWTDPTGFAYPVGVLPGGAAFLVQIVDYYDDFSRLYAVSFDGDASLVDRLDGVGYSSGSYGPVWGQFPACSTVRRLGPACELYCHDEDAGQWLRLSLASGETEPVLCSIGSDRALVVDVWQR